MMDRALIQEFVNLIASQTGLSVRLRDRGQLQEKLFSRMRALRLSRLEDYYQLLENLTTNLNLTAIDRGKDEWQELINLLTVTESYFFRDLGQFNLLKHTILPELISKKKCSKKPNSLKIWSAACSLGQEPYSLAILIQELLPDWKRWDISIVGTDINSAVLDQAKRGLYNDWSFRLVDLNIKQRYFKNKDRNWEIDPAIRKMVKFLNLNLAKDPYPNPTLGLKDIDIILCRNVFIYFDRASIARVLSQFYKTLQPGGYLMTAHAELQGHTVEPLQTTLFPNSVVYRRPEEKRSQVIAQPPAGDVAKNILPLKPLIPTATVTETLALSSLKSPPSPRDRHPCKEPNPIADRPQIPLNQAVQSTAVCPLFQEAMALFDRQAYTEAIQKAEQVLQLQRDCLKAYFMIAQSYANLGEYHRATYYCMQAIEIDPLSVMAYYLLAQVAELQGKTQKAKFFLKRMIYIEPNSIIAYLELAALYQKERDIERAKKMQEAALELLQTLPKSTILEPQAQILTLDRLQPFISSSDNPL